MRYTPRQAQRYPVLLQVLNINDRPVSEAFVLDVSHMGAQLEVPLPLRAGEPVVFSFFLPDEEEATRLQGRVIWVQPARGIRDRYRMGLCFVRPNWWLPPACLHTFNLAEAGVGPESPPRLMAPQLQTLEQMSSLLGKLAAEIGDLRAEVAQLRASLAARQDDQESS